MAKPRMISEKLGHMVLDGTNAVGSYHPDEVMPFIEEDLTLNQYDQIHAFLTWVVDNKRTFGWNIREVYAEYMTSLAA